MKTFSTLPSINLNGTSADELCREIQEAHDALTKAREALANMTVHGRDHYVKADKESFNKARAEHDTRFKRIDATLAELGEIHQGIRDQV